MTSKEEKTGGGKRNQRKRGLKEPKPPFLRLGEGGEKPPFCLRSPKKGFLGRGRKKIEGGRRVSLLPKGENINRGGREIDGRRRHATNKEFQTHCSLLSSFCSFRDMGTEEHKKSESSDDDPIHFHPFPDAAALHFDIFIGSFASSPPHALIREEGRGVKNLVRLEEFPILHGASVLQFVARLYIAR